jgi:hypothetical protein
MDCPICRGPSVLDERHPEVELGRCTRCGHRFSRIKPGVSMESYADVILCNAPLASLDIPVSSRAAALILLGGVSSLFALGSISGRTYSQTVVCRRGAR